MNVGYFILIILVFFNAAENKEMEFKNLYSAYEELESSYFSLLF